MNKKGFTLVELLAVIVILAVVMLIAVTSVGPMMEKSRKSSLGDEGVGLIKAADTAYRAEGLKGPSAEYTSTTTVCYDLKYLCDKGYFEKGCGSDGYTGSVLVEYKDGKYNYKFWLSNGTYTFNAATKENYGDIENVQIVYNGPEASTNCGETSPSSAPSEAVTVNNEIKNNILHGSVAVKTCKDGSCNSGAVSSTISFTINGTSYTTDRGKTWGEWILSTGSSTGNTVLWVTPNVGFSDDKISSMPEFQPGGIWYKYRNDTKARGRYLMIYMETGNHSSGLPNEDFVKWTGVGNNSVIQTYTDVIEDGGVYGGFYWISDKYCCFDAGTQITMADGTLKNIEDIKVGDMVLSYNENTGEFEADKVTKTMIRKNSDDLVYVYLSDGTKLGMRAYHPLLSPSGYKSLRPNLAQTIMDAGHNVEELKVGDTIIGKNGNATVTKVETRPEIDNYNTYTFTVEKNHNYIANGFVAHNAPC